MGMEEIYTAEVRRQQELAIAKEEDAYQQLQAAGRGGLASNAEITRPNHKRGTSTKPQSIVPL